MKFVFKFVKKHGGYLSVLKKIWIVYRKQGVVNLSLIVQKKIIDYKNRKINILEDEKTFSLFNIDDPGVVQGISLTPENLPKLEISNFHEYFLNEEMEFKKIKVGIFIHVYYTEQLDEILIRLLPLSQWEKVIITTDTEDKKNIINNKFKEKGLNLYSIKVVPNIGRDIAPRLVYCKKELEEHDFVVFIHTKKSLHISKGSDWREYLWSSIIGTPILRKNILGLFFKNPKLGMLAPHHWPHLLNHQPINWGYNFSKVKYLLGEQGENLLATTPLDFPSGSMFWTRSSAIKPLLDKNLTIQDFEPELGQIDGTLAHAIERAFFYICEISGHQWLKYSVNKNAEMINYNSNYSYNLLHNNVDLGTLYKRYPEASLFPVCIENNHQIRLNLLIPTLRKSQVYGGIKTAVTLFAGLVSKFKDEQGHSDFQVRVIITDDSHFNNEDFLGIEHIFYDHENLKIEIISAGDRTSFERGGLPLSSKDYFLASAWWNARQAQFLQKAQRNSFGKECTFFYLVQDFEPGFYAWSSKSCLAEATYKSSFSTAHIINDKFLEKYFFNYNFKNVYCLDFALNDKLKNCFQNTVNVTERENILLFYGRPSVERNCFHLIIDAICRWFLSRPFDFNNWSVYSIGEDYSDENIPEFLRKKIKILGKLSLEDYSEILIRSKVGVALMQSPHPSYPPQEMAAAGLAVVTNDWQSKRWNERSGKYLTIDRLEVEDVSNAIVAAVSTHVPKFNSKDISNINSQSESNSLLAESLVHLIQ